LGKEEKESAMLVLARYHNEAVIIGTGSRRVRVLIVDVREGGTKVKLGIDAPPDMPVHREEVYADIVRQGGDLLQKRALLESVRESFTAFRDLACRLCPSDEDLRRSLAADLIQLAQQLSPPLAEKGD
jgi:carbon storage regulator